MLTRLSPTILFALAAMPACDRGGGSPESAPPEPAASDSECAPGDAQCPGSPEATAPAAASAATPVPATPEGVLQGLERGDRACYVQLEAGGAQYSIEGDFELCPAGLRDASALVGKQVVYTTRRAPVLATSCGGDLDCGKTDLIDVIDTLRPAEGAGAAVTLDALEGESASRMFGAPASKSREVWGSDGGEYTTWKWAGVELVTAENGAAHSVMCEAPCALRTELGIGVGSTRAEVEQAYGKQVNKRESTKTALVVGDIYEGIIFAIDDGKVVRIIHGTHAE